jgi:hypothetical protein
MSSRNKSASGTECDAFDGVLDREAVAAVSVKVCQCCAAVAVVLCGGRWTSKERWHYAEGI